MDRVGARIPLSVERIVLAAIDIMDRHGMAGLTMRKLGSSLDVEAMSLYGYFPNKTALLAAARTTLFDKLRGVGLEHEDGFDQLREVMRAAYRIVEDHPCFVDLVMSGPSEQPTLRQRDADLAALRAGGLSAEEADYGLQSLISFVLGFLYHGGLPAPEARGHDGTVANRRDASFEFGLELLLSGLRDRAVGKALK